MPVWPTENVTALALVIVGAEVEAALTVRVNVCAALVATLFAA
jgi:hypothetical protein